MDAQIKLMIPAESEQPAIYGHFEKPAQRYLTRLPLQERAGVLV